MNRIEVGDEVAPVNFSTVLHGEVLELYGLDDSLAVVKWPTGVQRDVGTKWLVPWPS